jgi:hypothetical protein
MKGGVQVYINRAKALLLVGTISAGCASCSDDEGADVPSTAGTAGSPGAGAGGTSSAGTGGTAGTGGGAAGTGGTGGAAGTGGAGGTAGTGGSPSGGGTAGTPTVGDPDAGSSDAGDADASAADASGPDAGDGGALACLDTADTLVTCDDLGQGDCTGLEGFLSSECEMIEFIMKTATANAARNCMLALDPPELCDATNTYACLAEALGASCPDAEADDECADIASVCDESLPAFSACSSALSGMTQDGRDQMVTCMTTQGCDLNVCIEGLSIP